MSLQESVQRIVNQMDDEGHTNTLITLSARWADEKEHEDFADYEKKMKEEFSFVKVLKATKRPFGFHAMVDNTKLHFHLKRRGRYSNLAVKYVK
ncbi:MAG: hypothetical protein KAS32_06510 [Candidatus Peribacteraceae bacterium]|nr:hypothetical protein [Candidatus Peribacteraceae bacterium]